MHHSVRAQQQGTTCSNTNKFPRSLWNTHSHVHSHTQLDTQWNTRRGPIQTRSVFHASDSDLIISYTGPKGDCPQTEIDALRQMGPQPFPSPTLD